MKSKLPTLLLSFIVAMGLWLYVVTTVSPEADQNYTGIPVVFENETSLLDRGLMLVSGENAVSTRAPPGGGEGGRRQFEGGAQPQGADEGNQRRHFTNGDGLRGHGPGEGGRAYGV